MGIKGLLKFIENEAKDAFEHVNLSEIADLYRCEMKEDPIMLIDISSCASFMISSNETIYLMNGELRKFQENIEKFCNKFSDLGIKLKVVYDGLKSPVKHKVWLKNENTRKIELEKLYSGKCEKLNFGGPGIFLSVALPVFQSANNCEVWRSMYEADSYIMNFAKKINCFAILSNDSDFLLAEGVQYLLSPKYLNLDSMTTYNYSRNKLAKFLGIEVSQLPIFASLCFHTDLETQSLSQFYCKNKINFEERFKEIAKFLKTTSLEGTNVEPLLSYKRLGLKTKVLKERINFLTRGSDEKGWQLTGIKNWDEILILAEKNFHACLADRDILEVLLHRKLYIPLRGTNVFKPSPDAALKSFRKKIYGILFFEIPNSKVSVREFSIDFFKQGKYVCSEVSFVRRFHPGLLVLWSPETSDEAYNQRRKVFCQALNENLKPDHLISKDIQEELLFPLLASFYLYWELEKKISSVDVKTILIQAVIVNRSASEEILKYPGDFHLTALELSDWFLKTLRLLYFLNSVCGNPYSIAKTNVQNFFDGKVFHYVWAKTREKRNISETFGREVNIQYRALRRELHKIAYKCGHPTSVEQQSTDTIKQRLNSLNAEEFS